MDQERAKAERDLHVIRSLMERATVYRAISAPAALVAGFLSIFGTAAIYLNNQASSDRPVQGRAFAAIWLAVLYSLRRLTHFLSGVKRRRMDARSFRPG